MPNINPTGLPEKLAVDIDEYLDGSLRWKAGPAVRRLNDFLTVLNNLLAADFLPSDFESLFYHPDAGSRVQLMKASSRAFTATLTQYHVCTRKFAVLSNALAALKSDPRSALAQGTLLRSMHEVCAGTAYFSRSVREEIEDAKSHCVHGDWQSVITDLDKIIALSEKLRLGTTMDRSVSFHINDALPALRNHVATKRCMAHHLPILVELFQASPFSSIVMNSTSSIHGANRYGTGTCSLFESRDEDEVTGDTDGAIDLVYDFLSQLVHPNEGGNLAIGILGVEVGMSDQFGGRRYEGEAVAEHYMLDQQPLNLGLFEFYKDLLVELLEEILRQLDFLLKLGVTTGSGLSVRKIGNPDLASTLMELHSGILLPMLGTMGFAGIGVELYRNGIDSELLSQMQQEVEVADNIALGHLFKTLRLTYVLFSTSEVRANTVVGI